MVASQDQAQPARSTSLLLAVALSVSCVTRIDAAKAKQMMAQQRRLAIACLSLIALLGCAAAQIGEAGGASDCVR